MRTAIAFLFLLCAALVHAESRGSAAGRGPAGRSPAVTASAAVAPRIDLYADVTMSGCEIIDDGTAYRSVYVFVSGVDVSGVSFAAPQPECWAGATYIGDVTSLGRVGNSQTGVVVVFDCINAPLLVLEILYFATGGESTCCRYRLFPDPLTGNRYWDCHYREWNGWASGETVVINPDASCHCQQPVATETSTWGRVKSLYR
jgi:hypothetical protein